MVISEQKGGFWSLGGGLLEAWCRCPVALQFSDRPDFRRSGEAGRISLSLLLPPSGLTASQFCRVSHLFFPQIYPQSCFYENFLWIPKLGRKGKGVWDGGGSVAGPCQLPQGEGETVWTTAPKQRQNQAPGTRSVGLFRSEGIDSTILIFKEQDRMFPSTCRREPHG